MEIKTRLVTRDSETADLYLPKGEWKKLVAKLNNNKMIVVLRIEGVG